MKDIKKIKVFLFFLLMIIIMIIAYNGCDVRVKPQDIDSDVWNYCKKICRLVNYELNKFSDFEPVVEAGMVTFNSPGKKAVPIKDGDKRKYRKLLKEYIRLISNSGGDFTSRERELLYSSVEFLKSYIALDYLVEEYDITSLEIISGMELSGGNEEVQRAKRLEIISHLNNMKSLGEDINNYFNYTFESKINKITEKIKAFK